MSKDFIDLGGGATPRPREDPKILLRTTGAHSQPMDYYKFKKLLQKYKDTKRLDREDFNSGAELGAFIDFLNNTMKERKEKEYNETLSEINKYYWKLWIEAIDSR